MARTINRKGRPVPPRQPVRNLFRLRRAGNRGKRKKAKAIRRQQSGSQKNRNSALLKSEQRLRLIMEHANDAIFYLDLHGIVQWASRQAAAMTGRHVAKLQGLSIMRVLSPEAAAVAQTRLAAVRRGEQVPPLVELDLVGPNGRPVRVEANITSVRERGTIIGRLLVARDITARKRAEERLQEGQQRFTAFMENLPGFAWMKDVEGRYVYVNKMLEQLEQYRHGWFGKSDADLWPLEIAAKYRANDQKVIASRESLQTIEPYLVKCERRHVVVSKFPIENRSGAVVFVGGVGMDITEQKQSEKERQALYERLQESHKGLRMLSRRLMEVQEQERKHFARELHDEIGQVLTAAKINIQQAMQKPGGHASEEDLAESVELLDRTLQQIRNLSLDLRPSLLDDLGLISTLKWMVERHAQATKMAIHFTSDLSARFFPEIELACYRVAQEALTNAVRHAGATQIAIELKRSGNDLELRVRDNGVGFSPEGMLARAREGKSLGLLGMQERVALSGGTIDIRSFPRRGTEIRASFPVAGPRPSLGTDA